MLVFKSMELLFLLLGIFSLRKYDDDIHLQQNVNLGLTPDIEVVISVVLGVKFNCICTELNFYHKIVMNIRLFHVLASSLAGVCPSQWR